MKKNDSGDDYRPKHDVKSSSNGHSKQNGHQNSEGTSAETKSSQPDGLVFGDAPESSNHISSDGKRTTPTKTIAGARRSTRERRPPKEWWKKTAISSVAEKEPVTFSAATKEENSAF